MPKGKYHVFVRKHITKTKLSYHVRYGHSVEIATPCVARLAMTRTGDHRPYDGLCGFSESSVSIARFFASLRMTDKGEFENKEILRLRSE